MCLYHIVQCHFSVCNEDIYLVGVIDDHFLFSVMDVSCAAQKIFETSRINGSGRTLLKTCLRGKKALVLRHIAPLTLRSCRIIIRA